MAFSPRGVPPWAAQHPQQQQRQQLSPAGRDQRSGGRDGPSPRNQRGAAEIDRDAKLGAERLKEMLRSQSPWTREVEAERQATRNLYLLLPFAHPHSPYSTTLDPLWITTTYTLISSYRQLVTRTESHQPASNNNSGQRKSASSAHALELRKVLTRFRQALASEETFYRQLVARLTAFYGLQEIAGAHLAAVSIPVGGGGGGGADEGVEGLGKEEKREKLGLVYKGLVCLGDLERYKEQYSERARGEAREATKGGKKGRGAGGKEGRAEEKYAKAKEYYEVARGLMPDDGAAFNQLAVISTYLSQDLLTAYYYFRALAVRSAFKGGEEILEKFLRKLYERWAAQRDEQDEAADDAQGGQSEGEGAVETFKRDLLLVVAVVYRRTGLSNVPRLKASILPSLASLVRNRSLPSETVVKITALAIGSHWRARSASSLINETAASAHQSRRREAEEAALDLILSIFGVLVGVSTEEVEAAQTSSNNDVAVGDDDDEELHLNITAVLRRLLPSLRIISKWLKLNVDYLSRFAPDPAFPHHQPTSVQATMSSFWQLYRRLIIALARVFPISRLPGLPGALEEDEDMRGYVPLSRGLTKEAVPGGMNGGIEVDRADGESGEGPDAIGGGLHDVHPNEEQLMRISDLQVDAKLLMQTEAGAALLGLPVAHAQVVPPAFTRPQDHHDEIASVSTETEDDPVNLAMRATLGGGGSSVDSEEARRDDEMVHHHGLHQPTARIPPTAFDLLQNLMLENANEHTPSPPAIAQQPQHNQHGPVNPHSPGLLFGASGGDGTKGASIWSMTREESEKGRSRQAIPPSVANIWGAPGQPAPTAGPQVAGAGFGGGGNVWGGATGGYAQYAQYLPAHGQQQQQQPQQQWNQYHPS